MLRVRNLDDQTYEEIVRAAEGRLPWLCPEWTDHNAHDPGITILELMAWYKEMQQYHLNQFTDELCAKLLKLAGVQRRPAQPARCSVKIPPEDPGRPVGTPLHTREGVPFELAEDTADRRPVLQSIRVERDGQSYEVGDMLKDRPITFQPFSMGGKQDAVLRLGFAGAEEQKLRLWFTVEPPQGAERTPFHDEHQVPRVIDWRCEGAEETVLLRDDTHALSVSGYVFLRAEGAWPEDGDGLRWLTLTLTDPGCEEDVRLSAISARQYNVVQQETWAKTRRYRAEALPLWQVTVDDGWLKNSSFAFFVRTADRWTQTDRWQQLPAERGRTFVIDTEDAVQDGEDNVLIVSQRTAHSHTLLFDAKGLPGETLTLRLDGRMALEESFLLLCETLHRDGIVRPAFWRCVESLSACGPRDRVFTYDPQRETINFGDGEHGALLQRGKGAVLVADLVLSRCGGGNIPGGSNLYFDGEPLPVPNTAAHGGVHRETPAETRARLLQTLSVTEKCVSAADYERLAVQTPGLRVAEAKALPAYDPDEPTGVSRGLSVAVVVVPAGGGEKPMPDGRFLTAVQQQLDRVRPIGVQVRAVAPVYVEIDLSVSVRTAGGETEPALREAMADYLCRENLGIGRTLRADDVFARVQAVSGVLQVREVDLHTTSPGCYRNSYGDIQIPRQAIPHLRSLTVECLPMERAGW